MAKVININGTIGSYTDKDGKIISGVELVDVIAQAENSGAETEIQVVINSPGGLVDVGYAIYDYLTSLKSSGKTITTVINGMCASIATIIALAGDKRQIVKGSKFLIHNPFITNAEGDADSMRQYAETLDTIELGLAKFYSKITGIGHSALSLIMKEDKEITAEKALELKFVTEIIDGTLNPVNNLTIVAVTKQKPNSMDATNILKEAKELFETVKNMLAKSTIKNMDMKTKDGKTVTMEAMTVGSDCTMDGKPCVSMTMEMENGTVVKTDAEGKISEVTPKKEESTEAKLAKQCETATMNDFLFDEKGELLKDKEVKLADGKVLKTDATGKVIEAKDHAANLLSPAEIITLKAENAELKVTIAAMKKIQEDTTEEIKKFAKLTGSTFKVEDRKTILNRSTGEKITDTAAEIRASRNERNKK